MWLLLLIICTSLCNAHPSYCQWKVDGQCKVCTFNLFLYNGTCVKYCPSGYVERRPNWVKDWKREIGAKCEQRQPFYIKAWGRSSYDECGDCNSAAERYVSGVQTCGLLWANMFVLYFAAGGKKSVSISFMLFSRLGA